MISRTFSGLSVPMEKYVPEKNIGQADMHHLIHLDLPDLLCKLAGGCKGHCTVVAIGKFTSAVLWSKTVNFRVVYCNMKMPLCH